MMNEKEVLKKIEEVVFSVPGEIYKYPRPVAFPKDEWANENYQEKGFDIIEGIIMEYTKKVYSKRVDDFSQEDPSLIEINLGNGPHFYSKADENMFLSAIYTMPSYTKIIGDEREMYLCCKDDITKEEVRFLTDLFKRYNMEIPAKIQELYNRLINI